MKTCKKHPEKMMLKKDNRWEKAAEVFIRYGIVQTPYKCGEHYHLTTISQKRMKKREYKQFPREYKHIFDLAKQSRTKRKKCFFIRLRRFLIGENRYEAIADETK